MNLKLNVSTLIILCFFTSPNLVNATDFLDYRPDTSEGQEGHGGDSDEVDFFATARWVQKTISEKPIQDLSVDAAEMEKVISNVKLVFTNEDLHLGDKVVSAINFPKRTPQEIHVNRNAWKSSAAVHMSRERLVFHELLSLMGISDSQYQWSSLLSTSGICSRNPSVVHALVQLFNKNCSQFSLGDLSFVTKLTLQPSQTPAAGKSLSPSDFEGLTRIELLNGYVNAERIKQNTFAQLGSNSQSRDVNISLVFVSRFDEFTVIEPNAFSNNKYLKTVMINHNTNALGQYKILPVEVGSEAFSHLPAAETIYVAQVKKLGNEIVKNSGISVMTDPHYPGLDYRKTLNVGFEFHSTMPVVQNPFGKINPRVYFALHMRNPNPTVNWTTIIPPSAFKLTGASKLHFFDSALLLNPFYLNRVDGFHCSWAPGSPTVACSKASGG